MLTYHDFKSVLANCRLPAMIVDLDAFDRNVDRHLTELASHPGLSFRLATKSVRVVSLIERTLNRAGNRARGLMCFSAEEAAVLADRDFDDLLIAYPTLQRAVLSALAERASRGVSVSIAVDSKEGVDALLRADPTRSIKACICIDMSLALPPLFLGVRRSPLRHLSDVLAIARYARDRGISVDGVLGYEALVAGLPDDVEGQSATSALKRSIKQFAMPKLCERRAEIVRGLVQAGFRLRVVNGGGTGSLGLSKSDPCLTEVTAGSGFFKPHLFDAYRDAFVRSLEPAAYFALEVTRKPSPKFATCAFGGYVASGSIGNEKAPLPVLPTGLALLPHEMAGEVQTPLAVPRDIALDCGSPVIFRHAKAGELAERFGEVLLVSGNKVVDVAKTYRGEGWSFG